MRIFKENLYFITTETERFCEIIAYRSNVGKINIGDNALDLLGVDSEERGFLIRNLFLGGDDPIIIISDSGALIVNRKMLYSTGICCIACPELSTESVCYAYYSGGLGRAIMSPKAKAMTERASSVDSAKAYLELSGIERMLSIFGDKQFADGDIERTAMLVCDCIGCGIEFSGEKMACTGLLSQGMIYANSIYAISVLLMAFLAKIISDDRVLVLRQSQSTVSISTKGESSYEDTAKIIDYILRIAQQRDLAVCANVNGGVLIDMCPFFLDVGLTGVKNPIKLIEE